MSNIVTMENQTLGLQAILNARQLGGYKTVDGHTVRPDVLLRTGALGIGTPEDLAKLTDTYHLRTVIDFRTTPEITASPDPVLPGVDHHILHVIDETVDSDASAAMLQVYANFKDDPGRALLELYRMRDPAQALYTEFLSSDVAMTGYRRFFDLLLAHKEGSILWHCTGGKDRTGIATILFLSILGVDRETTMADFALTNVFSRRRMDYMRNEAAKYTDDPTELDGVAHMVGVDPAKMEVLFDVAEAECGSMCAFVQKRFGLTDEDVAALRSKYLI